MNKVVVVGSINMDLVLTTSKLPQIGETIMGEAINYFVGGKGANQAVAASRVGGEVSLIGATGNDIFGKKALNHIENENIATDFIEIFSNVSTGIATVFQLPTDNAIVVTPGANSMLERNHIENGTELIEKADVLVAQLEIPIPTVKKALQLAKDSETVTILNPAPFTKDCIDLLKYVDIITPNETEFEGLIGKKIRTEDELEKEMIRWSQEHKIQLIITRGSIGTSFMKCGKMLTIPTIAVEVKDTTGAGDTFNGILATLLSRNESREMAIQKAGIGASLSVEKQGAQTGMPVLMDILKHIN